MKQLKKRTLALVLASVVTVVGSFAAENYKNCLMSLSLNSNRNGQVYVAFETKTSLGSGINLVRKDANTYVVTLPEVNSADSVPIVGTMDNISSINVRTMPYSNNSNGYTRVTIKTTGAANVQAYNKIYVASTIKPELITGYAKGSKPVDKTSTAAVKKKEGTASTSATKPVEAEKKVESSSSVKQPVTQKQAVNTVEKKVESSTTVKQPVTQKQTVNTVEKKVYTEPVVTTKPEELVKKDYFSEEPKKNSSETFLLLLAVLLIIVVAIYSYIKAKDKLTQLAGEQITLDLSDDTPNKKKKKDTKKTSKSSIRGTIKNLDSKYPKNATMVRKDEYTISSSAVVQPTKEQEPEEEVNVVDLDEIFQEQVKNKAVEPVTEDEEENSALEDFLSGFSFDEEFGEEIQEEPQQAYDVEIFESIINNGDLKFSKNDIDCINKLLNTEINDTTMRDIEKYAVSNPIKKTPTKQEILEKLVTDYTISQNISFTSDDVSTLFKLISVEIDRDFIEDLRTNPERTKEMQEDILNYGDKPKKPSQILTLNVKDMLPDLSEALRQQGNKKIESNHKAETVYFSEGYEVSKLKISEGLPDLSKELAKKDAYASKPTAQYDIVDNSYSVSKLKISDELPDLADAMAHPEKYKKVEEEVVVDEQALLNNIANVSFKPFDDGTRSFEVINDDISTVSDVEKEEDSAKRLLEKIKRRREERKALDEQAELLNEEVKPIVEEISTDNIEETVGEVQCMVGGVSFKVLDSINFTPNSGCHLVKNNNGYAIMAFVGDNLTQIKTLEEVKIEKIQSRMAEVLEDGSCRYIVRVGATKFIVNADNDFVNYVMDL